MTDPIGLEVCVDSPAGLLAAVKAGADRIELCSSLALSGLTPAPGLMALAARQTKPSYAMIRAHSGPFRYSRQDLDVMCADIDAARAAGLPGVVIGANRADGSLDEDLLRALAHHAAGLAMTLHRAFDLVPDFEAALETAIDLGFERILTSGGAKTAVLGAERIARLVVQAGDRISIMAGCGVGPGNVADLVRRTGVREVHGSLSAPVVFEGEDPVAQARSVDLGFVQAGRRDTDPAAVAQVVRILAQLA